MEDSTPGQPDEVSPGPAAVSVGRSLGAVAAFTSPAAAAGAVLELLRAELGFRWWAVTRLTGGTYVVLHADPGFPAAAGQQLPWAETLCHRMAEHGTPCIAPDVQAVPAYRDLALTHRWQVGAYLSVPLSVDGTSLFGTLCAVDPDPQPAQVSDRLPQVELLARLLSTIFATDLQLDLARRRTERAEADALLEPLTGLVNRRGWQLLLDREEQRCARYGSLASVLVIDLDGLKAVNDQDGHAAGDTLLHQAAQVLRGAFRSSDVLARLGGDEFAVLAVQTDADAASRERDRLQARFDHAAVPASVGVATRDSTSGLTGAWHRADSDMYQVKQSRRPEPNP